MMNKFIIFFVSLFLVSSAQNLSAQNELSNLIISDLAFPDTVSVGSVAVLSGIVTNNNAVDTVVLDDFILGINFSSDGIILNDFDYSVIADYINTFFNKSNTIPPGESRSFSQPVYMSNQRVDPNKQNLVITWPIGREETERTNNEENDENNVALKSFYVEEAEEVEEGDCSNITIGYSNDKIKIKGLFAAQHAVINVVDMNHRVIFHCEDNCPADSIILNITEPGFYLANVNLFGDDYYCFDSDVILTEGFLNIEELIGDYNYFPNIDELMPDIGGLIPDIDSLTPDIGDLLPDFDYLRRDAGGLTPDVSGIIPDVGGLIPDVGGLIPDVGGLIPDVGGLVPDVGGLIPDVGGLIPDVGGLISDLNLSGNFNICGIVAAINNNEIKIKNTNEKGDITISVKDETGNIIYECNNNCGNDEIIVQLPELEGLKYSVEILYSNGENSCSSTLSSEGQIDFLDFENPLNLCSYIDSNKEPVINKIIEGTVFVIIPGFSANSVLEYRIKDTPEWESYSNNSSIFVLTDLEACSTYEVRAKFVCNNEVVYSKIQSFMTEGCDDCNLYNVELFAKSIFGNTAILNWDIIPGVEYELNYKEHDQDVWSKYKTSVPFALLLGLEMCTIYDFFIEAKCKNGFVSPGDIINFETGNCKNTNDYLENQVELQPSVAKDYVDVIFNSMNKVNTLQLIDASGNTLIQIEGDKLLDRYRIDLSNFPAGFYIVNVNASEKQHSKRFIKR